MGFSLNQFQDTLSGFSQAAAGRIGSFQSFLDVPVTAASRAADAVRAVGGNAGGIIQGDIGGPVASANVQAAANEGFSNSQGTASPLGVTGSLESTRTASGKPEKILGLDRNVALVGAVVLALIFLPKIMKG